VKLVQVTIRNFKLISNISIDFSQDRNRPLTVIRAENGSGKTSVLYALLWGLFGEAGLDKSARTLRRTSASSPAGVPITVEVSLIVEHQDDLAGSMRYRLTRSQVETPLSGTDSVEREDEKVELVLLAPEGDEPKDPIIINKLFPPRLKDVFFTNGEHVETFIAGTSASDTQHLVHDSIRQLLNLDKLDSIALDLENIAKKHQKALAAGAGKQAEESFKRFEESQNAVSTKTAELDGIDQSIASMRSTLEEWQKKLTEIQGAGNLTELLQDQQQLKSELEGLENSRGKDISRLRDLLVSEESTWLQIGGAMNGGLEVLQDLYDKNVIPGVSLPVLEDRLKIGVCVCGEQLTGDEHDCVERRQFLEALIEEQKKASKQSQKLTQTYHLAENSRNRFTTQSENGESVSDQLSDIQASLKQTSDAITTRNAQVKAVLEQIDKIDEAEVKRLRSNIKNTQGKLSEANQNRGRTALELEQARENYEVAKREHESIQKKADKHDESICRLEVTKDIADLTSGAMSLLKTNYVQRVADRMAEMFMSAVGANPTQDSAVFTGLRIDSNFNIVVETADGKRLNPSYELNGASQRVLTLSFIWALTEVAGAEIPRIIDTPLGMISGSVKKRLIQEVTAPPAEDAPPFQVVLLLTRSEISGVEEELDRSAGAYSTLSCNKDSKDLKYDWGIDKPTVASCSCSHRQSCKICARHIDNQYGIQFQAAEGV
jgi:DNA sulfur modification protein DndD